MYDKFLEYKKYFDKLYNDYELENKEVVANIEHLEKEKASIVSVLGPDWEGFIDSVTGVLHAIGTNLNFVLAFRIEEKDLGFILAEVKYSTSYNYEWWKKNSQRIKEALEIACLKDNFKKELLKNSIIKLESYEKIKRHIIKKIKESKINMVLKSMEIFVKNYPDIENQNLNYLVKLFSLFYKIYKKVIKKPSIYVNISLFKNKMLIGIGSNIFISGDKIFYMLQYLLPDITEHKYSEYMVGNSYIYLIEIEHPGEISSDEKKRLINEINSFLKQGEIDIDISVSEEEFYKTILPQIISDYEKNNTPHLYIQFLPGGRSRMKVTLVVEKGKLNKNIAVEMAKSITTRGLKVFSIEKPAIFKKDKKEYEVHSIYVTFRPSIFGNTYNVHNHIKKNIEKMVGKIRDFAGTFPVIFQMKFQDIAKDLKPGQLNLLKFFFFKVIDNRTKIEFSADVLSEYYHLFRKTIEKYRKKRTPVIKAKEIKKEIVIITVSDNPDYFEKCLDYISDFKTITHRVDMEDFTVGIFRVPVKGHDIYFKAKLKKRLKNCLEKE